MTKRQTPSPKQKELWSHKAKGHGVGEDQRLDTLKTNHLPGPAPCPALEAGLFPNTAHNCPTSSGQEKPAGSLRIAQFQKSLEF